MGTTTSSVHHHTTNQPLPIHCFHPSRLVVQGPIRASDVLAATCSTPPSSSPPRPSRAWSAPRARPTPRARPAPRPRPALKTRPALRPARPAMTEKASTPLTPTVLICRSVRTGAVPNSTPVTRFAAARPSRTNAMRPRCPTLASVRMATCRTSPLTTNLLLPTSAVNGGSSAFSELVTTPSSSRIA